MPYARGYDHDGDDCDDDDEYGDESDFDEMSDDDLEILMHMWVNVTFCPTDLMYIVSGFCST